MKILVIGYGSMGRRRVRILKEILPECSLICVDNSDERLMQMESDKIKGTKHLSEGISLHPDIAFVCTSPRQHAEIILELIKARINVFTELNLISNRYDDIISVADENNVKVFMSNTMLYDKQIISIQNKIREKDEPLTYIFHVGQYLPDWHPWESYKDFFIGKKETNGCREILAIQFPWIIRAFGPVEKVSVIKKRNTKLEIDFDDTYIITLEHKTGHSGVFVCDVLARNAVSYLEVMGENTHIQWNGTPETLFSFNSETKHMEKLDSYENVEHLEGYADIIIEDQYRDEVMVFIDWVNGKGNPLYSLKEDQYILELIDEIEENE